MFGKKEKLAYGLALVVSFLFFLNWEERSPTELSGSPSVISPSSGTNEQATSVKSPSPSISSATDKQTSAVKKTSPSIVVENKPRVDERVVSSPQKETTIKESEPSPAQASLEELSPYISPPSVSAQSAARMVESNISSSPTVAVAMAPSSSQALAPSQTRAVKAASQKTTVSAKEASSVKTAELPNGEGDNAKTEEAEPIPDKPFSLKISLPQHHVQRRIQAIEITLKWNESLIQPMDPNEVCYDTSGATAFMQHVVAASVNLVFPHPFGIDLPLDLMTCRFLTVANANGYENPDVAISALKISAFMSGKSISYAVDQANIEVSF